MDMVSVLQRLVLLCGLTFLLFSASASAIDIKHSKARKGSVMDEYAIDLLKFLIEVKGEVPNLTPYEGSPSQPRKEIQLRTGELDVDWFGGSTADERRVEPIRYPIFRGLLGFRIFIANRSAGELLSHDISENELKNLTVVQGEGWGDVEALRSGGFKKVKTLSDFESLFRMIAIGRADLFPRSIIEPYGELAARCQLDKNNWCKDANLMIDSHFLVAYRFPLFFFVSPERPDLKVLLTGAFRDHYDEFLTFFNEHPLVKTTLKKMKGRKVIRIDSTDHLSRKTKEIENKYWLKI